MTADWVPTQVSLDLHARPILDTALGILIGLRRCPSVAAFHELLGAAQRHLVPVFAMAGRLCISPTAAKNRPIPSVPLNRPRVTKWGQLFT